MSALLQKLVSFFMSILAFFGILKGNAKPAAGDYEVQKTAVVFALRSNPTTGYSWDVKISGDAVVLSSSDYRQDPGAPNMAGRGGTEYFTLTAVKPGAATVTFSYLRPWEGGPIETRVAELVVDKDLNVTVRSFTEAP